VLRETDPEWRERELENLAKATAAHVNLKHIDPVTFKQWRAQRSAVTRGVSPRGPNTMRAQVIRLLTTTGGTIENVEAILLRRYTEVGSMPKNSLRRRALGMIKVIRAYNGYDLETDPATGVIRATQRRVLRKTQKAPKSAQRASLALA